MKTNALVPALVLSAMLALPSSAHAYVHTATCNVVEIMTFSNRVHFKCDNVYPAYFAVPTSSSAEATRLVTLASTALMGSGKIQLWYETLDGSAESYGCMISNCRRPIQLRLFKG